MKVKVTLQNTRAFCLIALGYEPSETTVNKIVEQIFTHPDAGPHLRLRMAEIDCSPGSKEGSEIKAISEIAENSFYEFTVDSLKHPATYIAVLTGKMPDDEFVLKMVEVQKEQ